MKKIKDKMKRLFQDRYGIDELGKALLILGAVAYVMGVILQNGMFWSVALFALIYAMYRMMSRQHWDRGEENRRFTRYVKLWKMRWQERKTSRIYVCNRCGKMIRVPKGRGKIQITCPQCGSKTVKRT